ncbi:alpha/beta hydrolase [Candidatus Chloroploca asiatica]|uniref:Phospholipase n=1 Tax=Candidatus Chloroploca asiatica TaxID=1506545 RepID=A0A2H3KQ71_9CHLR|nr:alpha/beta hydrolase-fold protein [Candidatus Chloroploca asiatica]PDW00482.1 phospholipase [Candidatus Chloroploca asiatica]
MTTIHTIERKPRQLTNEAPPLLLLLHGYGANEHDLFDLADYVDPHFYVVSARAPLTLPWGGYAWYHLGGTPGRLIPDPTTRTHAVELAQRFVVDLPARIGTNPRRTYLFGFSQGAIISLALSVHIPEAIAGIIASSGYLDPELVPTALPEALTNMPILQMHGTYDDVIPVTAAHHTRALLEPLPVRHTYQEYPVGHGIHPDGVRLMQQWLGERLAEER